MVYGSRSTLRRELLLLGARMYTSWDEVAEIVRCIAKNPWSRSTSSHCRPHTSPRRKLGIGYAS